MSAQVGESAHDSIRSKIFNPVDEQNSDQELNSNKDYTNDHAKSIFENSQYNEKIHIDNSAPLKMSINSAEDQNAMDFRLSHDNPLLIHGSTLSNNNIGIASSISNELSKKESVKLTKSNQQQIYNQRTSEKDSLKDIEEQSSKSEKILQKQVTIGVSEDAYFEILCHFKVFSFLKLEELEELKYIYPNRNNISIFLSEKINLSNSLKDAVKLEIFILLTVFCFTNNLDNNEICCLFSIFDDILNLNFRKNSKKEVFDEFKSKVIKCSMNRPPFQVGIFKKKSIELISTFYIDNIYCKHDLILYLTTKKVTIELNNKELFNYTLPHTLDLEMGEEILPRHHKILKQYTESKKLKSELEQKIDTVLDFERDRLDKNLEEKFKDQDNQFNKKLEEILSKKKK